MDRIDSDAEGWGLAASAADTAALRGERLGPFLVEDELGRGGMGRVLRALDTRLQRRVAIKVLPLEMTLDDKRRARFLREARLAAGLSHPNICAVHELGEHGSVIYLVLELLVGETLRARLARGAMPWREALPVAQQIARALSAAHDAGLIHRDLKPENVMLTPNGVKVLDFGLARPVARPMADDGATETALTQEGVVVGTPSYMSPEQVEGRNLDVTSDVFAFGIVLYEMLVGHAPFNRESSLKSMMAIMQDEPEPVREQVDELPEELAALVEDCLAKAPSVRPAGGAALVARLPVTETSPSAPEMEAVGPSVDPGAAIPTVSTLSTIAAPSKRARWGAALASAVVAVVVACAIVLSQMSGAHDELTTPVVSGDAAVQADFARYIEQWSNEATWGGPTELFVSSKARDVPVVRALGAYYGHVEASALAEAVEASARDDGPAGTLVRFLAANTTPPMETLFWSRGYLPRGASAQAHSYLERYSHLRVFAVLVAELAPLANRITLFRGLYSKAPSARRAYSLAVALRRSKQHDAALAVIDDAVRRFPAATETMETERAWVGMSMGRFSTMSEAVATIRAAGGGLDAHVELEMNRGHPRAAAALIDDQAPRAPAAANFAVFACSRGMTGTAVDDALRFADRLVEAREYRAAAATLWALSPCVFAWETHAVSIGSRLQRLAARPDLSSTAMRRMVAGAALFAAATGLSNEPDPISDLEGAIAQGYQLTQPSAALVSAWIERRRGDDDSALAFARAGLAATTPALEEVDFVAPWALRVLEAELVAKRDTTAGAAALAAHLEDKDACLASEYNATQSCRAFVFRALVLSAELACDRGDLDRARRSAAEARGNFPYADGPSPVLARLAAVEEKIRRGAEATSSP